LRTIIPPAHWLGIFAGHHVQTKLDFAFKLAYGFLEAVIFDGLTRNLKGFSMGNKPNETPALLIIDMVKDNFVESRHLPITPFARAVIQPLNILIGVFHSQGWPIVFATDAFHGDDFIFKGRMRPHSLAGTEGAELIDALDRQPDDLWLPKPRFSAFFNTGLEKWLRQKGVSLCAVGGIATHFCVLTTVLDAICHDFKSVLLEDCSASSSIQLHQQTLDSYRRNPLHPLLRVAKSTDLASELLEK
jgi:nicotinamidase/pyrazinamidase